MNRVARAAYATTTTTSFDIKKIQSLLEHWIVRIYLKMTMEHMPGVTHMHTYIMTISNWIPNQIQKFTITRAKNWLIFLIFYFMNKLIHLFLIWKKLKKPNDNAMDASRYCICVDFFFIRWDTHTTIHFIMATIRKS